MWIFAGVVSALAILFVLLKLDFRKVLYFDIFVDIVASAFLMVIFAGTFAGMMAAVVGGAVISITLYFAKKVVGYKRLVKRKWYSLPHWEAVQPKWRTNHA